MGKLATIHAMAKGKRQTRTHSAISPAFRNGPKPEQLVQAFRANKQRRTSLEKGKVVPTTTEPSGTITMRGSPPQMRPHASAAEIHRVLSEMKKGMREASTQKGTKTPKVVLTKAGEVFEKRLRLAGMSRKEVLIRLEFQNTMSQIKDAMKLYEQITGQARETMFKGTRLHPTSSAYASLRNLRALNSRGINDKTVALAKRILETVTKELHREATQLH